VQHGRLLPPVVIPQRRPGSETRGFVRASAPVLVNHGTDQACFLKFLKELYTHSKASPLYDSVLLGSTVTGWIPNHIAVTVSTAVQVAAKLSREGQQRWKTDGFLEQANKQIFMPRGLFAMIVTYKPRSEKDTAASHTGTNEMSCQAFLRHSNAIGRNGPQSLDWNTLWSRLQPSNSKSETRRQLPSECAPLIYPAAKVTDSYADTPRNFLQTAKPSTKSIQNCFDKKAQAKFVCTLKTRIVEILATNENCRRSKIRH